MTKRRPERIRLRVTRGALVPADRLSEARLRGRAYNIGDEVFAEIKKPRNPGFHRLAHALTALAIDNIEGFEGMDAHRALKRLQLESGCGCEEIAVRIGKQMVIQRIPLSLSFESMDEAEFQDVVQGICHHLATAYWPDTTVEEILAMAQEHERSAA